MLRINNQIVRGAFADCRIPLPRFNWFVWIDYLAINYFDRFWRKNERHNKEFAQLNDRGRFERDGYC